MAATVKILRWTSTSGSPVKTDITSTTNRAATMDDPAPGTANPIPVPTSSTQSYSFWVATRLSATVAPATAIQNLKWYADGVSPGTGVLLNVATASAYIQATGTTGTTGNQLTSANYGSGWTFNSVGSVATNSSNYTSGGTLSLTGSIGNSTGDFGDFVVYQVQVSSNAGPGPTSAKTVTFQYNQT